MDKIETNVGGNITGSQVGTQNSNQLIKDSQVLAYNELMQIINEQAKQIKQSNKFWAWVASIIAGIISGIISGVLLAQMRGIGK